MPHRSLWFCFICVQISWHYCLLYLHVIQFCKIYFFLEYASTFLISCNIWNLRLPLQTHGKLKFLLWHILQWYYTSCSTFVKDLTKIWKRRCINIRINIMKLTTFKAVNLSHFQGINTLNSIQAEGNNFMFTYAGYRDETYTVCSRQKEFVHTWHKYAIFLFFYGLHVFLFWSFHVLKAFLYPHNSTNTWLKYIRDLMILQSYVHVICH
jgi:hypothetical protein